jgi:4-hydroxy-3-methylbut-2-enyl diphosphate reductase
MHSMGTKLIEIDPSSGFCFGVENAINIAEQNLSEGGEVYGLGLMVHNEAEIGRLDQLGLKTISAEDFPNLKRGKVIFRAHGEPPATYELAKEHQIEIVDATCSIVASLQRKISKRFQELKKDTEQIVIYGKNGHPETIGLIGQTNGEAILITDPDDVTAIDPNRIIYLYSQTTMDPDQFTRVEDKIRSLTKVSVESGLVANCTICGQMKKRKPGLKFFAHKHELILFLSGKKSSNGEMLFKYCKQQNGNTYWIHSAKDINPEWIKIRGSIGISGATSTPSWLLREVKDYLETLMKD